MCVGVINYKWHISNDLYALSEGQRGGGGGGGGVHIYRKALVVLFLVPFVRLSSLCMCVCAGLLG